MTRTLVNLPSGFFTAPELIDLWQRLGRRVGEQNVRSTSHDTPEQIATDLAWAEAVLMWSWPKLDEALLVQAPDLRFAGHIDLVQPAAEAELKHGLSVAHARGGWSPAVAEMALGLMLTALRGLSGYHAAMRSGTEAWAANLPDDFPSVERELTGRTVSIVGLGRVGRRLAELLAPFHVTLKVHDPYLSDEVLAEFNAERCEVLPMAAACDVLVLCAANNPGTAHLIDAEVIAAMPPHAILINVARAALVDTDALVARLAHGDLIAALDVFETEPLAADHPLRALPNALLTPHRAGGLRASVKRCIADLIEDFERHLNGQPLARPVTEAMIPALDAV